MYLKHNLWFYKKFQRKRPMYKSAVGTWGYIHRTIHLHPHIHLSLDRQCIYVGIEGGHRWGPGSVDEAQPRLQEPSATRAFFPLMHDVIIDVCCFFHGGRVGSTRQSASSSLTPVCWHRALSLTETGRRTVVVEVVVLPDDLACCVAERSFPGGFYPIR